MVVLQLMCANVGLRRQLQHDAWPLCATSLGRLHVFPDTYIDIHILIALTTSLPTFCHTFS